MKQTIPECSVCGKEFSLTGGGNRDDAVSLCRNCEERGQIWASIQAYKTISGVDRGSVLARLEEFILKGI